MKLTFIQSSRFIHYQVKPETEQRVAGKPFDDPPKRYGISIGALIGNFIKG